MKKTNQKERSLQSKTILLILTGSIAIYKSGDLIRALQAQGARVICVMTESAKKFITPLTIRTLSREMVYHDFFSWETPHGVVHVSLAEAADLILAAPASANFIARLAAGLADDLAACLVLAAKKPVVIVPAMNDAMYLHPLTQMNIQKLKEIGYRFVGPIEGPLADGRKAVGHIADNQAIVQTLEDLLARPVAGTRQT
ncbi:MAG: hypothetical protein NC930_03120 [Candidatus Omnitrophica bacterium]|nr:hypothetical protein [Candidatus Omnitrophota bacterium]